MTAPAASVRYRFARFELQPDERRLLVSGRAAHLGPHAFDLLVALVEQSGHLVTKDQLLARVWGKVVVEENTLQAHVSALRKVLGPEAITTISGRGYRFSLDVAREVAEPASAAAPRHNLPQPLTSFIGRDREIAQIERWLTTTRLLTLAGAGGCGKTRLALQVAGRMLARHPDGVWFVELAPLADPSLVAQAVAKALGVTEQSGKDLIGDGGRMAGVAAGAAVAGQRRASARGLRAARRASCCGAAPGSPSSSPAASAWASMASSTYRVPSLTLPDDSAGRDERGRAGLRGGALVHRSRQAAATGLRGGREGCRGAGVDLPPPRRHRAGHRAGGAAGPRDVDGGAEPAAGRPLRRADRRLAHGAAASPHAALADRLEPRSARRCREGGAAACIGLCRRLDPGSRRVLCAAARASTAARCWTC